MTDKLLIEALEYIANLDPEKDSKDGYNEWGESDCFRIAQKRAKEALGLYNEPNKHLINQDRQPQQCLHPLTGLPPYTFTNDGAASVFVNGEEIKPGESRILGGTIKSHGDQMKTLSQLYAEHTGKVSDKWGNYLSRYNTIFESYRDKPIRLLEIGVQNGGSLEIWAKYFAQAISILGIDIDPRCDNLEFADSRIAVLTGDCKTVYVSGEFDIIIDDGSHTSGDIIANFEKYWPKLNQSGLYIVEDLHCSYWPSHNKEGELRSIQFLAGLINSVNQAHHDMGGEMIDSIEFSNSLCVIRKGMPSLGERIIVGKEKII